MKPGKATEKQRREHVEALAILARIAALSAPHEVRRLFIVLSV